MNDTTITQPRVLSLGAQTMLRGLAISMVVLGHSIALIIDNLPLSEQIVAGIFGKLTAPCVFFFVVLMGYGQGLKKKRIARTQVIQRVTNILYPYLFWATISFILYHILKEPFWYPFTGQGLYENLPMLIQYIASMGSFTISWQYYFLGIYLFFQWYAYRIRHQSDGQLWKTTNFLLFFHAGFLTVITLILWIAPPEKIPLPFMSAFIYPNPIAWGFAFYLGFYLGAKKTGVLPKKTRLEPFLFLILWAFGSFELVFLLRKWGGVLVIDQFTLSGFLFGLVFLIIIMRFVIRQTERMASGFSTAWHRWLMRFGKHSLLIFLLHLPFQWFILMAIERLFGFPFHSFFRILILAGSGLYVPYAIGTAAQKIPGRLRKAMIGF